MSNLRVLILILFVLPALVLGGQDEQPKKKIVYKSAGQTSPASGAEMYQSYCASCHGMDGKGGGPAAEALKVPPTNLTQLARRNGGKFPSSRVRSAIEGDTNYPGHGTKDMPVWGRIFINMRTSGDTAVVTLRVNNLTAYVESLQER